MQTTLRFDEALIRQVKAQAAKEGVSLTRFIERAVRTQLAQSTFPKKFVPVSLPSLALRLKPGVGLKNNHEIWDALDAAEISNGRTPKG